MDLKVPFDGIIGIDLLRRFKAKLTTTMEDHDLLLKIPVNSNKNTCAQNQNNSVQTNESCYKSNNIENNTLTILGRAEQIIPLKIKNINNGDCLIPDFINI